LELEVVLLPTIKQDGWLQKTEPGEPTMRKYKRQIEQAKEKAANRERLSLEAQLPMSELIAGVRGDIEGFAAELGLTIIQRVMAAEIDQKVARQELCRSACSRLISR